MRIELPAEHQMNPLAHLAENYAADIVQAGLMFSQTTYDKSTLSLREFEGARYRTALINGCNLCQAFRAARDRAVPTASVVDNGEHPDEAFYAAVPEYKTSDVFSARECLAIEYAERMGLAPQDLATDEAFWAKFKAAFSDAEIVDLSFCVSCWMGLGRTAHVLGLDGICAIPALQGETAA
ncbi:MAG: carboxymuconolactone decarboxylase family protein [Pseudomonadota bacterium]